MTPTPLKVVLITLLALCAACSTTRREIPILSDWPAQPHTVVGYISAKDDHQAMETGRKLNADALVLASIALDSAPLAPPLTTHTVNSGFPSFAGPVVGVGGDSYNFDANLRRYYAIKWRPELREPLH